MADIKIVDISETEEETTTAETTEEETEMTTKELLAAVNKAIMAIMIGGQSYKIGSRALTRADLKRLQAMRQELEAQVTAEDETNKGLFDDCYVALFDRR